jgi:hypothetical protein
MRSEAGPTAVIMWLRDGGLREVYFPSRFLAEVFLALIPFTVETDGTHEVAAAMLSPVIGLPAAPH